MEVPDALRYVATARATHRGPLVVELEGPGDPLASAGDVLRLLALLDKHHPDVRTGLVIDGPLLDEYADELADFGVSYVVLRLDAASQRTAERLATGATYRGDKLTREAAAKLLLDMSHRALDIAKRSRLALAARITLLPTINDLDVPVLARLAAERGAQRVDVVAPDPSLRDGDLRAAVPSARELASAQAAADQAFRDAGGHTTRGDALLAWLAPERFRAVDIDALDAVDVMRTLPGVGPEDDAAGALLPRRRAQVIAVTSRDGTLIDLPLAQARQVMLYAVGRDAIRLLGTRALPAFLGRRRDGVGHAPTFLRALVGCHALVTTRLSARATTLLRAVGIRPVAASGRVEEVVDRVARGTL